jgi:hypothetical protein
MATFLTMTYMLTDFLGLSVDKLVSFCKAWRVWL